MSIKKETLNNEIIKADYIIKKPNPLLLMRDNMTLTQERFFAAYLSKVNPLDKSTYTVRFTLKSFYDSVGIVDRRNRAELEETLNCLVNMLVDFSKYVEKHSTKDQIFMKKRHLFEGYDLYKNEDGEYYVDVLPSNTLIKLLQGNYGYITPKLCYELPLSTKKHMRMYDFFYQMKNKHVVTIYIENLKAYLGMGADEYKDNKDFISKILKKGIKDINQKTDLYVTYMPIKTGKKITQFMFTIRDNPNPNPLSLIIDEEQISFDAMFPVKEYRASEETDVEFNIDI